MGTEFFRSLPHRIECWIASPKIRREPVRKTVVCAGRVTPVIAFTSDRVGQLNRNKSWARYGRKFRTWFSVYCSDRISSESQVGALLKRQELPNLKNVLRVDQRAFMVQLLAQFEVTGFRTSSFWKSKVK